MKNLFVVTFLILATGPLYAFYDANAASQVRNIINPIVMSVDGVQGSMIGLCIPGSDDDPFADSAVKHAQLDVCIVYFVRDKNVGPQVRAVLKAEGMFSSVQIRFEAPLPTMENQ